MPWVEPSITLRWGAYTKLDGDEQQKIVTTTVMAKKEGIITMRMAVEKVASIYGIENVDAALNAIEEEAKENAAKALEQQSNLEHAMTKLANGSETTQGGSQQPKETEGSSGAASAGAE